MTDLDGKLLLTLFRREKLEELRFFLEKGTECVNKRTSLVLNTLAEKGSV